MYKFCILPPVEGVSTVSENVELMADILRKHIAHTQKSDTTYTKRCEELKEDMKRQHEIQERVRLGEVDASQLESASKYPEPVFTEDESEGKREDDDHIHAGAGHGNGTGAEQLALRSDPPACHERFIVFVCVDTNEIAEQLEDKRIGPHRVLLKLCGAFDDASEADAYAKVLKEDIKYKSYDVAVAN
eukprot:5259988-Pleurochrysis_carterae.AAC.1